MEQLKYGYSIKWKRDLCIKGVDIDEGHLAVDVIDQLGPGGQFMSAEHTFKHFKNELWTPTLLDRQSYGDWKKQGEKTMGTRITDKMRKILNEHKPEPLGEDVVKKLDEIVECAEQRMR